MKEIVVYLEMPHKAVNVGTIVRTCFGFGIKKIVIKGDKFSEKELNKISSGAIKHQKIDYNEKYLNYTTRRKIATVVDKDAEDVSAFKFKPNDVICFGTESSGLSEEAIKLCDCKINIRMNGKLPCFNLGVANGIILYAIRNSLNENEK